MVELGPVMLQEELAEVMGGDPEPAPFVSPDPVLLVALFEVRLTSRFGLATRARLLLNGMLLLPLLSRRPACPNVR
jgi:hypothetical protein